MDHPTFCRIEYWNPVKQDWSVGHAGTNLMNPALYAQKLGKNGHLARIIEVDTGETVYSSSGAELL